VGDRDPSPPGVLLLSTDHGLVGWLERLAATAGVPLRVSGEVPASVGHAGLVLVGADLAATCCQVWAGPRGGFGPRLGGNVAAPRVVVAVTPVDQTVWRDALALGAEQVALLPEAEGWLTQRLADVVEPSAGPARVVGVIGGRGGAGASVLAAALGVTAAASGVRTLLLDADPLGGGLDLVLGAESATGLRWPELASSRGRLQPGPLVAGLPCVDGLLLLSQDRDAGVDVPDEAMAAVLAAASRAVELIVLDLPRAARAAAATAVPACELVLLVVPAEVRASAAARCVLAGVEPQVADVRLVVRGPSPSGLLAETVAQALQLPLAGELKAEPGLAAALERGEPPGLRPRGPLGAFSRRILTDLLPRSGRRSSRAAAVAR
jgi:secretion/DNA translocation related CpaE-like protein